MWLDWTVLCNWPCSSRGLSSALSPVWLSALLFVSLSGGGKFVCGPLCAAAFGRSALHRPDRRWHCVCVRLAAARQRWVVQLRDEAGRGRSPPLGKWAGDCAERTVSHTILGCLHQFYRGLIAESLTTQWKTLTAGLIIHGTLQHIHTLSYNFELIAPFQTHTYKGHLFP